jgi:hypothetical protein
MKTAWTPDLTITQRLREAGAGGSNPLAPTKLNQALSGFSSPSDAGANCDPSQIAPKAGRKSNILAKHIKHSHKRISRMLDYALTLGGAKAWSGFTIAALSRLTAEERAALAWAALNAMDTPEQAEMV